MAVGPVPDVRFGQTALASTPAKRASFSKSGEFELPGADKVWETDACSAEAGISKSVTIALKPVLSTRDPAYSSVSPRLERNTAWISVQPMK